MSELRLRIHQFLDGERDHPPRIPVTIRSVRPWLHLKRARPDSPLVAPRRVLAPLSHRPEDAWTFDLEPGRYSVESVLPSGEVVAEDVTIAADETKDVVLRPEASPHESLSWQHAVGNLRDPPGALGRLFPKRRRGGPGAKEARVAARQANRRAREARRLARREAAGLAGRGPEANLAAESPPDFAESGPPGGVADDPCAPPPRARGRPHRAGRAAAALRPCESSPGGLPSPRSLVLLSRPHPLLVAGEPESAEVWSWLAGLKDQDPRRLVEALNGGQQAAVMTPCTSGDGRAVYRFSLKPGAQPGVMAMDEHDARCQRHFAVAVRDRSVELLTLPVPWRDHITGREACVEVALDLEQSGQPFVSTMTARDEDFGPLLGYLSTGALITARELTETAKEMLFDKQVNPLAAAAGGYAMVGTALHADDREWHGWIRNLMNQFDWLPDGAIQWAQLRLRMRRNAADVDEAKEALRRAWRRGLPFYSTGLRWLIDGLERVSRDDPEAEQMCQHVRRVAWMTNYRQSFTILRLEADDHV